ncbi:MAG: NYN domain-containing protein [Kiritimatiellia bacterium]|nr:NYN domain-containing protein [Kiritimatiellia bacterium]
MKKPCPRRSETPRKIPGRSNDMDLLIVDGFSLLHRHPESLAILNAGRAYPARRFLVGEIGRICGALAERTIVVFDGQGDGGPAEDFAGIPVEVCYSPSGTTADLVIERLVRQAPDPDRVLVVTSDRQERESVDAAGARHMGCGDFLEKLKSLSAELDRAARTTAARAPPNRMDDWFPKDGLKAE